MSDTAPPPPGPDSPAPGSSGSSGSSETLRGSEKFLQSIIENIPDMVFVKDAAELRFVRFNNAGAELIGYPAEEMIGKNDWDLFPASEAEFFIAKDREVLAGGAMVDIPAEPIDTRFNGRRVLHTKKIPILGEDGEPEYLLGISEDITERIESARAIEDARLEAEEANRAKTDFLSRMSHELRTPLNAVLGFAQLLEMDLTDESELESVRHILSAGSHLLDLINDVLDISRIDSGALSVSLDSVPVASAMDDSLVLVAAQARDAGVAIEVSEAASSTVRADRQRLRQVLVNLLSNAIKFNRAGGAVTMRSEPDPMSSTVTISVTDTGCGIAPEMLDRIFTPYDRLGAERSGVEGTGLGLALSKRLCDAMGATIAVESALGEGCRFSITLDAAPDPDELPSDGDAPRIGSTRPGDIKGVVLHVEDNTTNQHLVRRALAQFGGISLLDASTAEEGTRLASEHLPDLVLLDIHLPDRPGRVVLEHLRSDPRTSDIPVVVLSADATVEYRRWLADAEVLDFLRKPLGVRRLVSVISEALS